ncbi:MAG: alpha-ketoglutarate-dependent dioxygenase AlkB, partial [Thermodesulfobacteriota bacterium]
PTPGLHYDAAFVTPHERDALVRWLETLHPIWEDRFTERRAAATGAQRQLLRPVYWLGSWQFACLDYYRPPAGVSERCVRAEPFPPVLARLVRRIETLTRATFRAEDLPPRWRLNTCLVNLYGSVLRDGKAVDTARVGEHRDFEPGPVASISLGERALFQFVTRGRRGEPSSVVHQQWLGDGSLLVFGGETWKDRTLHRVQRVDRRAGARFSFPVEGFATRRVNFTLRFVPEEHFVPFARLAPQTRDDVRRYVQELARHSPFFRRELERERRSGRASARRQSSSNTSSTTTSSSGSSGDATRPDVNVVPSS